jgi:iron-sulfur cluster insertion protein
MQQTSSPKEEIQAEQITQVARDMPIGAVIKQFPQVAEVFLQYGLHCVGCHVSYWETIEEGARGHGMSDEEIDMMVRDANLIIKDPKHQANDDKEIHLTPKAVEKIKSFMNTDEKDSFFRISLQEGGCSGYSYVFSIDKKAKKDDVYFEKDGLKCAIEKKWFDSIKGSTVDYIETLQESGFKVHNPNASNTCGCGSSFS